MSKAARVWTVPAVVVEVVDGDTVKLDLDLGWRVSYGPVNVRVAGVDAPELPTAEGKAAKAFVAELLPVGAEVISGDVIRAYQAAGWIYHGRVTVNKNPQAQAIRTKAQALLFVTKNKDSAKTRPALPDYLLMFSKPGDNPVPIKTDVTNDEWINWAQPVWLDIKETNTLNVRAAREYADERHIAPLQLDFIERCVRLWSNPGETVLTPFAGIGSEVYTAVKLGRRGIGCELKASYWRTAVNNLRALDNEMVTTP